MLMRVDLSKPTSYRQTCFQANCAEQRTRRLGFVAHPDTTQFLRALDTSSTLARQLHSAWAAWNYTAKSGTLPTSKQHVSVNYLINRLQPLPSALMDTHIIVSLNPSTEPDPKLVHAEIHYSHPVFDMQAIQAQKALPLIQGLSSIWYCGAWTGFGFHEDGLRSGELVAADLIENIRGRIKINPLQDTQ